jgi:hypothetical protein
VLHGRKSRESSAPVRCGQRGRARGLAERSQLPRRARFVAAPDRERRHVRPAPWPPRAQREDGAILRSPYSATLRDPGDFPLVNHLLRCSFNTDVRIYDTIPGLFVYCPCVEAFTEVNGVATFPVPGAGRNSGGVASFTGASAATFHVGNCGSCTAPLATARVATHHENGGVRTKGVGISDPGAWIADYNSRAVPPIKRRSDFNHGGTVGIGDLPYWARVCLSGQWKYACGALCPESLEEPLRR